MLQRRSSFFLRNLDISLACGVQAVREPAQSLRFLDGSLNHVAERSGPIDGELRAEFVSDLDCVGESSGGVLSDFGRLSSRRAGENRVMEGLRRNHRTADVVRLKGLLDRVDGFPLLIDEQVVGGDNVGIVRRPVGDADLTEFSDHLFKIGGLPSSGVEQGVSFIGARPLGAGDEELAAFFRLVGTAAGAH